MDRALFLQMISTIQDPFIKDEDNTVTNADLQIINSQILDLFEIFLDGYAHGRRIQIL